MDDSGVLFQAQATTDGPIEAAPLISWLPNRWAPELSCEITLPIIPGEPLTFRTRMRDAAGNLTTWSEPVTVLTGWPPYDWHADAPESRSGPLLLIVALLSILAATVTASTHATQRLTRRRVR